MLQTPKNTPQTCSRCDSEITVITNADIREFELKYATGQMFLEGGYKLGWKVEMICDRCADSLKRLLTLNGFPVEPIDFQW